MAGSSLLIYDETDNILIAVSKYFDDLLGIAARSTFLPQFFAGSAPEMRPQNHGGRNQAS